MRLTMRPMPVLTFASIAAFALLIQLGLWQWARYHEKLARIAVPPAEVVIGPIDAVEGEGLALLYGVAEGQAGFRVLTPVRVGERRLWIDAAFAPGVSPPPLSQRAPPPSLAQGVSLRGVALDATAKSAFTAPPDLGERLWFAPDLEGMASSAGLAPAGEPQLIATAYVGPDGRSRPNPFAQPQDPVPPERHLGYAITWWGLAAALVAIYLGFHVRAGRLAFAPRAQT